MAAYTPEQIETLRENLKNALDRKSKLRGIWVPDWSLHDELNLERPELLSLTELTKLLARRSSSEDNLYQGKTAAKLAYIRQSIVNAEARKSVMDEPSSSKVFVAIGGTTATGKSSIRKRRLEIGSSLESVDDELERTLMELIPYDGVVVDPDDAKLIIPEYQSHLKHRIPGGASFVHEESRELAEAVRGDAQNGNLSVIYDSSGQFNMGDGFLERMADEDYELNAIYYFSDIEAAVERAQRRAEESGRSVPEDIIRRMQQNLIREMSSRARSFQRVILIDSSDIENPQMMLDISPSGDTGGSANFINEDLLTQYWPSLKWWNSYGS